MACPADLVACDIAVPGDTLLNTENHRTKFRQVRAHLTELTPFFCTACAQTVVRFTL